MSRQPIDVFAENLDPAVRAAIQGTASLKTRARVQTLAEDYDDVGALKALAGRIKQHTLENLDLYLERTEKKLLENGAKVHWAADAASARAQILEILRENDARRVVKTKSMVTEEIGLNGFLAENGVEVAETDLGEFIIQLAGEPPSHIIAPVIHRRIEDISDIFQRELDMPPTLDPQVICSAARAALRREFLSADMGISGCNFAIAETGTCCIVTNEGNGRMTSTLPRVYVVVMGIEKLVPTVEDAFLQYQALCRSSTGQQCSVYLSMTSGPRKPGDIDGPEEFHVVLLDNGRVDMLAKGYGEALCCIRCGACLNVCPVYREIGGHAYGSTYSGPIGAVISPTIHMEVTDVDKLPYASSLCGACRDACPVKIDLPRMLVELRRDVVEEGETTLFDRAGMQAFSRMMQSRASYESAGKLGSLGSNLLAGFSGGAIKSLPGPLAGWTKSRDFPPLAKRSFREQWRDRLKGRKVIGANDDSV